MKYGLRIVQPNVIVHVWRGSSCGEKNGPRVGLIITKAVGSAVERHRVARQLRHGARTVLSDLDPSDRVVIRALPSSRWVSSVWLTQQLQGALQRAFELAGTDW